MLNLNEMRELKNVVERLANEPELLDRCLEMARELEEVKIHNAGICAIRGEFFRKDIEDARAASMVEDLVHAIKCYLEDGNESTFTIGNPLYPDAEIFDWKPEEDNKQEESN